MGLTGAASDEGQSPTGLMEPSAQSTGVEAAPKLKGGFLRRGSEKLDPDSPSGPCRYEAALPTLTKRKSPGAGEPGLGGR
jgi:hypothetical protein